MIYAHFFVAKMIWAHLFCCKDDLHTLFLLQKLLMHLFLSQKEFTHVFLSRKRFTRFFCRENDLRTLSGKFLRVESCHPESSDFLGLWSKPMATRNLADVGNRTHAQYVKTAVQQLPNGRNNLQVLHTWCVLQWIFNPQLYLFAKLATRFNDLWNKGGGWI